MEDQNDSTRALSTDEATLPIDPSSPAWRRQCPNSQDVYWADSTGRRNTSMVEVLMGRSEGKSRREARRMLKRYLARHLYRHLERAVTSVPTDGALLAA